MAKPLRRLRCKSTGQSTRSTCCRTVVDMSTCTSVYIYIYVYAYIYTHTVGTKDIPTKFQRNPCLSRHVCRHNNAPATGNKMMGSRRLLCSQKSSDPAPLQYKTPAQHHAKVHRSVQQPVCSPQLILFSSRGRRCVQYFSEAEGGGVITCAGS